jgi:hypothetical protein
MSILLEVRHDPDAQPAERAAAERLAALSERLLAELSPQDVEELVDSVGAVVAGGELDVAEGQLEGIVAGGLEPPERTRLAFEGLVRDARRRRELLEDAITAPDAARLIGARSRQAPHDRRRAGRLLAVLEAGSWRFPLWQFDPEREAGTVAGLDEVLAAMSGLDHYSQLLWLSAPKPELDGRTPIELLRSGESRLVRDLALGAGFD